MSYNPPKGMYKDQHGVARFINGATAPNPGRGKKWYRVEIVRKALDKEGNVIDKDKQQTDVYSLESEAAGFAFTRCPNRLTVKEAFEFKTLTNIRPLFGDELFAGHITEAEMMAEAATEAPPADSMYEA